MALILCNLNPESTNSKQEWNLFHDVSGLKNILWLILVSKFKKIVTKMLNRHALLKVFSFKEVLRCKHT